LPRNLAENREARFVLLDYNSQDGLVDYAKESHAKDIASGRLVFYQHPANGAFHVAHAKNMAARCAIREGAEILVTMDADNFSGKDFDQFVCERFKEPGVFLTPNYTQIQSMEWGKGDRPLRGFAGRLAVKAQDFVKAGGYNEVYATWRGEDIDFNARMGRMGYTSRHIDNGHLGTIPHPASIRFKEYPEARQYESPGGWKIDGHENDTVVNDGKFGCGTVYRNFDPRPIELAPVPTRVFGIGLHKTATTSLHKAFQILGFDSLHWGTGEAPMIWHEIKKSGRSKTLEKFYAACDLPIPVLYRELDKAYPGSKFILTIRDEEKWLKSVERLWNPAYNPTRWMWDVYPFSHKIHRELYGTSDFDPITFLERYRRHNAEVQEYFEDRPQDLLVMRMDSGCGANWDRICPFLGADKPSIPYPVEHVTRERELAMVSS
jgi:hypothetical protein